MSTTELVMPRLSDTMEEGTILRWLKADGEQVQRGEELVEIETDKATMVYESDLAGTLQIVAPEGRTLAVGELIAHVGERPQPPREDPGAQPDAGRDRDEEGGVAAGRPPGAVPATTAQAAAGGAAGGDAQAERVRASPLARRLARERGVELAGVRGSGPGGRIVRADVEHAPAAAGTAAIADAATDAGGTAAAAPAGTGLEAVATAKGETTVVALSRTQQAIARRMAESKATIPDFSVQVDVGMDACVALRTELKSLAHPAATGSAPQGGEGSDHDVPTYNDMVVKACALALREHPRVNGSYRDGAVQLHSRVNVGVAVASEQDGEHSHALVVPTVFDADAKALGEIARETRRLAQRVREQTITPPELGGGTFTVSNLGMFGVRSFTAIINPPQAAIVSVGALERRVAVGGDGGFAVRHVLALTLVCDHRVLYGADAARFAARVRELLEAPVALTL
jgi:pyruvate dehydrogenase E2 component (dihydrolipoamide acetyltransferase)